MKTTKLLASALLFAAVFGTAQAADTETLEAMKAQNGSVKTVLMDVFTTPAGNVDRVISFNPAAILKWTNVQ